MKKSFLFAFIYLFTWASFAQQTAGALQYLNNITADSKPIQDNVWAYISAVAHGKSAKKVDKLRTDMVATISAATKRVSKLPAFNGSTSLRDSAVAYLNTNYRVLTQDYAKVVNMEEIAEQSYDHMEAYMLTKQKADEKLEIAQQMFDNEMTRFAKEHNITLQESDDKQNQNMKIAKKVFNHYSAVYLVFFKSYKQEYFMLEAVNKANVNAIEQNRNALIANTKEGLAKLQGMSGYDGDKSVLDACADALNFYLSEAEGDMKNITNYFLKKEQFDKMKAAMAAKKPNQQTQDDVNQYNKAVKEFNDSVNAYNTSLQSMNSSRQAALDKWNKAVQKFLDKYVPN